MTALKRLAVRVPARTDRCSSSPRGQARLRFTNVAANILTAQSGIALWYQRRTGATNQGTSFFSCGNGDSGVRDTSFSRSTETSGGACAFIGGMSTAVTATQRTGAIPFLPGLWHQAAFTWDGTILAAGVNLYVGVGLSPLVLDSGGTSTNGLGTPGDPGPEICLSGTAGATATNVGVIQGYLGYVARWNRVVTYGELLQAQQQGPMSVPEGLTFCWIGGKDKGPYHLVPNLERTVTVGGGPAFPNTGGQVYEWRRQHISLPAVAAGGIKTVDGVVKASVKTWDSIAMASVKTINGVTN